MRFLRTLEGKFRATLKRHPLVYAFVAGVGIVLFWRGVWHLTDFIGLIFFYSNDQVTTIDWPAGIDSVVSLVLGSFLLLSSGLFISEFLSGQILITDVKKEEKMAEKTEEDVQRESSELPSIEKDIQHIAAEIKDLQEHIHKK
jgi:hypothetical protein